MRIHTGIGLSSTNVTGNDELVQFVFILSPGSPRLSEADECSSLCAAGGQSIIQFSPRETETSILPDRQLDTLTILVSRDTLNLYLRDMDKALPADFMHSEQHGPYHYCSPITPAMNMVLEQIIHCPYDCGLRNIYLQAKGMELIALRLGQFFDQPAARKIYPLSHTDIDRLYEAHTILVKRYANPPPLKELAKMVGINSNKLKYGFRQVFGMTVYMCIRNLRLEQARQMLQEEDLSVTEVAFQVGYSSLSHFARVFKSTYGVCPHAFTKL